MTNNVQTLVSRCPLCTNEDVTFVCEVIDRRRGIIPGKWKTLNCVCCGILFIDPLPTAEELENYYSKYYFEMETFAPAVSRSSRHPLLGRILCWLRGDADPRYFVQAKAGQRILDYGCGQAPYLMDFHYRGFNISGVEMAQSIVSAYQMQGFNVCQVDDVYHIPYPDQEFDVVYIMQVIEHIPSPHVFFKEIHRVLKEGGKLYLAMPNTSSKWRRVFGRHWVSGWFAPFHLFHYNVRSLSKLAEEHQLEMLRTWSTTPESWFRLNLKAALHPHCNKLDVTESVIDRAFVRYPIMILLRIFDRLLREGDCIVVELYRK